MCCMLMFSMHYYAWHCLDECKRSNKSSWTYNPDCTQGGRREEEDGGIDRGQEEGGGGVRIHRE